MRDASKYLSRAIESIQHQSLTNWELLIADNGSRDESIRIAESYTSADSRIRVMRCPGMILADVRNHLLRESRAEFVAWLDSDDIAEPERLDRQKHFLEDNPDLHPPGLNVDSRYTVVVRRK